MEYLVNPKKRSKGYGLAVLKELLDNGDVIIGDKINNAGAVIYPNNIASQKVFEKAGFFFDHVHPDGDAWYYKFIKPSSCFCGYDCSRCVTYLASINNDDKLRRQSQAFYRDFIKREISICDINCHGGRSGKVFCLCEGCPFMKCCEEKGIYSCLECENQCSMFLNYHKKYIEI